MISSITDAAHGTAVVRNAVNDEGHDEKPTTKRTAAAPADKLVTKVGESGDVELKEDELKKVSGGLIALLGDHK